MGCPRWHAAICGALASFAFSYSVAQTAAPAAPAAPTISVPAIRTPTITNQPPALPTFPKPAAAKPTPEEPAPPRAGTAEALEDGDRLLIPKQPSVVNVFGSVFNGSAFVCSAIKQVNDCLGLAGAPRKQADEKSIYLIRANGSVIRLAAVRIPE